MALPNLGYNQEPRSGNDKNSQEEDAQIYDVEKQRALREVREKERLEKDKARKTIKQYNSGKSQGQASEAIREAKNLAKNANPSGIFSLLLQANIFSDWMYALALLAALLKDLLDILGATGILYGVVILLTLLCSIFIALMMILAGFSHGKGRGHQKMIKSWLVLIGGTTVEMLFGLNFFPIETFTVLIVYGLALASRQEANG